MRNKNKLVILFLSFLLIFSNLAFVYAEDEIVNDTTTQIEQVEDKQIEEQKIEVKEEVKEEVKTKTKIEKTETSEETLTQVEETKGANPDGSVDVHYTNILSTLNQHKNEYGVPEPYEYDITMSATQGKTQTANGTLSYFGGKNYNFGYMGVQYTFLNMVTESENVEQPIYWENIDDTKVVTKVNNKNGDITLTYKDGSKKIIENTADLYLSPVYKQELSWKLEYNYIDNISTGSGSWSNLDAITSYSHTFVNPEIKSPSLTEGKYQFKYWEEEGTGTQYTNGDVFFYSGTEQPRGTTKTINTYAYWQPAVIVNLYNGSELIQTLSSFEAISSSDFTSIANTDTRKFIGWLDGNNTAQNTYYAPEITKEANYLIINLIAQFEDIIPDPIIEPKEPTTPEEPTTPKKPQINNPVYGMGDPEDNIQIADTQTPTTIINNPTPKAEPEGSWALINLIATILACICALALLFVRKDTEDDEPTDEEKKDMRKILATKIASILVGIISVIAFILTEDMSLPMVLTDKWTFLMILLLIIEIVNIFIIRRQSKGEEDDDNN